MPRVMGNNGSFKPAFKVGDVSSTDRLIVSYNKGAKRHRLYKIKCLRCGKVVDTSYKTFNNNCKSCSVHRPNTVTPEKQLWSKYKHAARSRGIKFNISLEVFSVIVKSDCFYCGQKPSQELKLGRTTDNFLLYNGVDRINNEGYEDDSCVACCWACNQAKRNYTLEQWKSLVRKWADRVERW